METGVELVREGRVWCFGDNINTDLIQPREAFSLPKKDQARLVFSPNRPGWVDHVLPNDIVVAGRNFGMGSGRPIGRLLLDCGIVGLVADSINGLGLRYCVVSSLPAMNCPGVTGLFEEGQKARIDFVTGLVTNLTTGRSLQVKGLPPLLIETIRAGGVIEMLQREGYIEDSAFHRIQVSN